MAKETKKPTHWLVLIPSEDGTYKDENGERFNILKKKISKNVHTTHKKIKGTTIKDFIKNSTFTKY